MPIYEYQGQQYDIETDDPQLAKSKILRYLETGKTKEPPASEKPAPVEGAGGAAFGVYPQAGRRPESQQDRAAASTMAGQTVRGIASAPLVAAGAAADVVNALYSGGKSLAQGQTPRAAQEIYNRYKSVQSQLAGNERQPLPELPPTERLIPFGAQEAFNFLPGAPETPHGQLAGMAGSQLLTPGLALNKAMLAGAGKVAGGVGDIAGGALGRATGYIAKPGETPTGYQVPSSRIPLNNEFIRPEDWAAFQRGELPQGQFPPTTPIQQLPSGPIEKAALVASGGEIPAAGQGMRAFGERLGETYRNPLTAAVDIGSMLYTGIPWYSAGKAAVAGTQGLADWMLSRKGFDPSLPEKLAAYRSGEIPMPVNPQTAQAAQALTPNYPPALPAPGPVAPQATIPMPGPGRRVNIEGQSYQLPYQIDVSQSQTARPQTPAAVAQQAAAAKVADLVPGTTVEEVAASRLQSPEAQAMMEQIRARSEAKKAADLQRRAAAAFGGNYRPPVAEAPPVAGPVAPTELPPAAPAAPAPATPAPAAPAPAVSALDKLKSKLVPQTPEETAAVEAYNAKTPTEKAAQTRAERKSKKNEPKISSMEELEKIQTPYIQGVTGESPQVYANIVDTMRNRPYMAGVERSKQRVKSTGEVFTPTPLVDEILSKLDPNSFKDPTKTFLDPAAGDGQILSEAVIRKIQNGSTHRQALETTYGVDIKSDNVKLLRDRLTAGNPELMPIAERNLLVGNALNPFEKVPGQTALDHRRMIEIFGQHEIDNLLKTKTSIINKGPNKGKVKEHPPTDADKKKAQELKIYAKSIGADLDAPN